MFALFSSFIVAGTTIGGSLPTCVAKQKTSTEFQLGWVEQATGLFGPKVGAASSAAAETPLAGDRAAPRRLTSDARTPEREEPKQIKPWLGAASK